jgi:Ankyrin repeats (3 copies)
MNEVPPSQDELKDVDDHYRRAAALDPSRPSELARRAVLSYAAQLAAERAVKNGPPRIDSTRPAANQTWRRPAIFGTLAAAALAGLLITPRFLTPRAPSTAAFSPGRVSRPGAAAPRVSARNAAPIADTAAEIAAKNAPAKLQSMANAQSTAAARTQSGTSTVTTMSAVPPQTAAPSAPASRPTDPAAALRRAAEIGNLPELRTLLAKQADIDARDASGRTALMLATLQGQIQAVDVLLAHGADPNAADAHGITPLQAAVAGDQPTIVAALQRAGAR